MIKRLLPPILLAALFLAALVALESGAARTTFQAPSEPILVSARLIPSGYLLGDILDFETTIVYDSFSTKIDRSYLGTFQAEGIFVAKPAKFREKRLAGHWKELTVNYRIQILAPAPGEPRQMIVPIRYWLNGRVEEERVEIDYLVSSLVPPSFQALERTRIGTNQKQLAAILGLMGFSLGIIVWGRKIKAPLSIFKSKQEMKPGFSEEISRLETFETLISAKADLRNSLQKLYWFLRRMGSNIFGGETPKVLEGLIELCQTAFQAEIDEGRIPRILETIQALRKELRDMEIPDSVSSKKSKGLKHKEVEGG